MTPTVQQTADTSDRLAAVRPVLATDASSYADRARAALDAGDAIEALRCLRFAADSLALAVRLGITAEETRAGVAALAEDAR